MKIDLEKLDSIALDTSKYPQSTLEIKYKNENFIKKVKFSTHDSGFASLRQLNNEWYKILKRRNNES